MAITKEDIEKILGENIETLDQLTTAIKNYIDNKANEVTSAFKEGDEEVKKLLLSDLDRLKEFKELIDSLDGVNDDNVDLSTILAGIKGDISANRTEIDTLKSDLEQKISVYNSLLERVKKLESDVNSLKQSDITNFDIWNELLLGLTTFRDTLKTSIDKFAIAQQETTTDSSSDDNVL